MEKQSISSTLKPNKKFFRIRFLLISMIFMALMIFQIIACLMFEITFILGIILIPLSFGLFYLFYYILYKKPMENQIVLENNAILGRGSFNFWQEVSFKLKFDTVENIIFYQTFMDKILHNNAFSLKFKFKKGHEFSFTHASFDKNSLIFLKKLYKKCDLERCNVVIDPKTKPYFVDVLSKILR